MTLLSEDSVSRVYLETINRTPYVIKISKTGELLGIMEYSPESQVVSTSQKSKNVEFG